MQYDLKEVHFEVTNVCPHQCKHCSTGMIAAENLRHLDKDKALTIVGQIAETPGTPKIVHLTGGEPLCYPDIVETVAALRARKIFTSIFTTGYRCDLDPETGEKINIGPAPQALLNDIRNAGLDEAVFSIHSIREDLQEDIMQTEDVLTGQYSVIQYLIAAGVKVKFNSVPMSPNLDYMREVVKKAVDLGVSEVRFLRFVPQGNAENHPELHVTKMQMNQAATNVKQLANQFNSQTFQVVTEGHPQYMKCRPFDWMGPGCAAGQQLAHINLNLDVLPCPAFKQKPAYFAGNIGDLPLVRIWSESEIFATLRNNMVQEKLDEPCHSCEFWAMCNGGCTAQRCWEGSTVYSSPDPICPKAE